MICIPLKGLFLVFSKFNYNNSRAKLICSGNSHKWIHQWESKITRRAKIIYIIQKSSIIKKQQTSISKAKSCNSSDGQREERKSEDNTNIGKCKITYLVNVLCSSPCKTAGIITT